MIYYNTRDNQNEKGTLSVYGNKLKLVNQYDNSYLVLIANIESGIVYICSLTVSKIYINPTIKEENFILDMIMIFYMEITVIELVHYIIQISFYFGLILIQLIV